MRPTESSIFFPSAITPDEADVTKKAVADFNTQCGDDHEREWSFPHHVSRESLRQGVKFGTAGKSHSVYSLGANPTCRMLDV